MTASRRIRASLGCGTLLVFLLTTCSAQTPGAGQTTPPTGGGGTGTSGGSTPGGNIPTIPTTPTTPTRPPTPSTTPQQPTNQTPFPEMQRPIFLSGRVMLDDGTPPSETVTIERICNGVVRPEAYTDSKGRFNFQLGQNMNVFADASVSSSANDMGSMIPGRSGNTGFSERDLVGCELRASLPGHRSSIVSLAGRRMMDNPDVGTILLHRLGAVEGYTVSITTAMAPKDAKKAFDKAREAIKKNKLPDAQREFEKAVQVYPKYALAWYNLGLVREQQKDFEGARKAYSEAVGADAKYVNPYMNLAQIAAQDGKWQDAADASARLIKLNAFDYPRAYFINGVANLNLKKLDEAETSARSAIKNDPDNRAPKAHHLLGVILAQKQDYAGAATEMKAYLQFAPNAPDTDVVKKQLVELEKFTAAREN